MPHARLNGLTLHYTDTGPPGAPAVVFAHALGVDWRMWEDALGLLPQHLRLVAYDMRGHGQSDVPDGPYAMGALVKDAEALLDHLNIRDCVFVGCSLGGMVAQALAIKRMDQVRALVLSNTAARIGTPAIWDQRIAMVRDGGMEALADATLERWFAKSFRTSTDYAKWRDILTATPPEGYRGCAAAISGTDFITTTSQLTLPTLAIAGSEDGSTPPDMVRETAGLIKGARFHLIRGAGHLPAIDKPHAFAHALTDFLAEIAHG